MHGSTDVIVTLLVVLAIASVFFAMVYPQFSGDAKAEKRRARLLKTDQRKLAGARLVDAAQRRKQIIESLQEVETREKRARRLTLDRRIVQAGLQISKAQLCTWSIIAGICFALVFFIFTDDPLTIVLGYAVGGFGVPVLVLNFLRKRRAAKFLEHFPAAIDVIVRGVRAGLPLSECLAVVARELPEPVAGEFRLLHEAQSVGFTMGEAVERLADRVPLQEARFFAILISIQQGSGGNLSEGLSNLSTVLRDRKKMQQKVRAMSAEAKASAGIIGALPFAISGIVYLTSPGYMDMFFTTSQGQLMLAFCAVWMTIGIVVMKRMITFDI